MKIHQQRFFQVNSVYFSFPHVSQGSCGDLHGDFKVALKQLRVSLLLFMVPLEGWSPVPNSHTGHGHQTTGMGTWLNSQSLCYTPDLFVDSIREKHLEN